MTAVELVIFLVGGLLAIIASGVMWGFAGALLALGLFLMALGAV